MMSVNESFLEARTVHSMVLQPEATRAGRMDLLRYLDQDEIEACLLFVSNPARQPYFHGGNFRAVRKPWNTDCIMLFNSWLDPRDARFFGWEAGDFIRYQVLGTTADIMITGIPACALKERVMANTIPEP